MTKVERVMGERVPDKEFISTFIHDRIGTVRECDDHLFELTAEGWKPFRYRTTGPMQLHEDLDSTCRIRELAFHLRKEGADKRMVTGLELIAIAGVIDRADLRAENHVRCPGCNHYGVIGHTCDRCDADIDRN